jgi:membrane protein DedA with SNARE-associated domain
MRICFLLESAAYVSGERYAHGERVDIPLFFAIVGLAVLAWMVWYFVRHRRNKRDRNDED